MKVRQLYLLWYFMVIYELHSISPLRRWSIVRRLLDCEECKNIHTTYGRENERCALTAYEDAIGDPSAALWTRGTSTTWMTRLMGVLATTLHPT